MGRGRKMEEFAKGSGKGEVDSSHNFFFWVKGASMRDC